jgi:hypothetical protein
MENGAPLISAVTTCKGRLEHLQTSLPSLMQLPDCEVIVVDYDCPDRTAEWVCGAYPAARVVKVADKPLFNLSHARNLGAAASRAPWLLMVDADVIVAPGLVEALRGLLKPGAYLLPDVRPYELWGTVVVGRRDFDAIRGYDEAFEGYGSEDYDLTARLQMAGLLSRTFPGSLLSSIPHADALRTQFYEVSDPRLNTTINELYRAAKMDLSRQGISLGPVEARALYAGARRTVLAADGPVKLDVRLPPRTVADRALEVTFTYQLSPAAVRP